jgi:hypothetical protein
VANGDYGYLEEAKPAPSDLLPVARVDVLQSGVFDANRGIAGRMSSAGDSLEMV